MNRAINTAIVIAACVPAVVGPARAEVQVPTIFGDHMVLQRGVEQPVWGRAEAGEKVTVSIGVAVHSGHPDYKTVLKGADKALYEAKHTGKNRVVLAT